MGTGYTRNDTSNNIADGNIVDAADLDGEFDAIQSFASTTGHTHDGTTGEGGPVEVIGPAQDIVAGASSLTPKTDDTYDLGSASFQWKDLYIDGIANIDSLIADTANIDGGTIDGATIGGSSPVVITASTATITGGTIDGVTLGGTTPVTITATAGTITGITDLAVADGGTGASTASGARSNLGVAIGSNVQAWDADLDAIAALAKTDGNIIVGNGSTWVAESGATARTSLGVAIGSDVQAWDADLDAIAALAKTDGNFVVGNGSTWVAESGATARTSLGLGSIATQNSNSVSISGGSITGITDLAVADGGTGASTASGARTSLGVAIGSDVLAHDANLQTFVDNFTLPSSDGTSGQALTTNGSGTLTFATPGGLIFLDSKDASASSQLDFTAFDAAEYDAYEFVFSNIIPTTDDVNLILRTSTTGGSPYDSSTDYYYVREGRAVNTSSATSGDVGGAYQSSEIVLANRVGAAASEDGFSGTVRLYGPHLAKKTRVTWEGCFLQQDGDFVWVSGAGERLAQEDVTAIRFAFSGGTTIASGTISMYGLRNS